MSEREDANANSSEASSNHFPKNAVSSSDAADNQEGNLIQFDLSDPKDLESKLSYLSEEEMDKLLAKAYQVNSELKHELQRQDLTGKDLKSVSERRGLSRSASNTGRLPPIQPSGDRRRRGFTSLGYKPTSQHLHASPVVASSKSQAVTKSTTIKPKPEWNGRFGI